MYNGRISPRKTVKAKENMKFTPYRNRATMKRPVSKTKSTGGGSANVKVVVRVRPPNEREIGANSRTVVKVVENNTLTFDPKEDDNPFFFHGFQQRGRDMLKKTSKNIQFGFDRVFGYESDNSAVFEDSTKNLLLFLMDGYNCSVFVYGATGAGKTHTMLGDTTNPGITYLTMRELFRQIDILKLERDFELGITYLEVYNETVKDLLCPGAPLHLREDGKFGVCVTGSKLHRIKNPEELFTLLRKGNANRTQHPTDANAESSRSHAVFQVYVDMATRVSGERRIAKLSMIDLAGSERGAATGCTGMRFTEGANINKSLLALGNCINSLADGHSHIPYRDSKLTRLLKDSLGGNCQTVMIANISPSSLNYEDTYNTLKYATRAKKIKSVLKKNLVNNELSIPQYVKLVENLNKEIENLRQLIKDAQPATVTCSCTSDQKEPKPIVPVPEFIVPVPEFIVPVPEFIVPEQKITVPEPVIKSEPVEIVQRSPEKWREELKILLQEKHMLQKQKQRLENSQELIKNRIKFKEISESTMTKLCLSNDQLDKGQNRIQASVSTYQRQSISVKSKLHNIQNQKINVETKLQQFINDHQISTAEDVDFLKNNANVNAIQYEIQVDQSRKLQELYQTEMDHKDKLLNRMAEVLNYYYKLQSGYGHITDEMAEEYRSIIRMAQGIRSVKWQDQEPDDPMPIQNQDSGISIPTLMTTPLDSKVNLIGEQLLVIEEECLSAQRSAVKRKLYDLKSPEDDVCAEDAASDDKRSKISILDETVVLPEASILLPVPIVNINPDIINNTFFINEKNSAKKKKLASDNLLPRVCKTLTNSPRKDRNTPNRLKLTTDKPLAGTMARTQRFPLRNKTQVPQKPLKPTKVLTSTRGRTNATTTQR